MPRRTTSFLLMGCLIALTGCSNNGLTLGRVQGKITYKGEPVPAGEVLFMPDESKGTTGPPASGTIGSDGTYVMSTEESGDGAVVGTHQVGIIGREAKPISQENVITDSSSAEDVMRAKAGLSRPQSKRKQGPTIRDRSGAVYRLVTPESLQSPQTSGITIKVESGSNTKNITIGADGTAVVE